MVLNVIEDSKMSSSVIGLFYVNCYVLNENIVTMFISIEMSNLFLLSDISV